VLPEPRSAEETRPPCGGCADVATRLARIEGLLERLLADGAPVVSSDAEWLTATQAARQLGMSLKALYAAVERRQVPATRLGRRLRFNRAGLDKLMQMGRRASR
jgi:excisionase family DNA binding protein